MTTRVFVYEYTCAAGLTDAPAEGLRAEGWAMLAAVLDDLQRLPGIEVVTLVHPRLISDPMQRPSWVIADDDEEVAFRALVREADFTLVIAPEWDDLLFTRCHWVEENGGRLLGPASAAVQLAADKWALSRHLHQWDVPTPECQRLVSGAPVCPLPFPVVCKPRFGAGSVATFLVRDGTELTQSLSLGRSEGWGGEMVAQPFVPGQAASVAFLLGTSQIAALQPATQELSGDGRFRYLGGRIPLPVHEAERTISVGRRAVQAVAGLKGYVGVDVVLGDAADGSQDWVIEINPRLTTSYVGLRVLAETNLAEAMLYAVMGEEMPTLNWSSRSVHFQPDGTIKQR